MKRWYDKHPIGKYLDPLKNIGKKERDTIIFEIMSIVKKNGPPFIDDCVLDFPLEPFRRRWYDKDPSLWIVFNGLQRAELKLLDEIAQYLEVRLNISANNLNTD